MNKDPYLIPGSICEVWIGRQESWKKLVYYSRCVENRNYSELLQIKKGDALLLFVNHFENIGNPISESCYKYYRVQNTEWKFADHYHVCSTVDKYGLLIFWDTLELYPAKTGGNLYINRWHSPDDSEARYMACGICPEKERYKGDAWKHSLREKPLWLKTK